MANSLLEATDIKKRRDNPKSSESAPRLWLHDNLRQKLILVRHCNLNYHYGVLFIILLLDWPLVI
jgi:hypothetical protein